MEYRLIAFDLDGTFLRDNKTIPAENIEMLKKAAECGIFIVPSSGRIFPGIPSELREAEFIRYYICSNGASVYDKETDRVIRRAEINCDTALRCVEYMETLPAAYDCYMCEHGYMNTDMLTSFDHWIRNPDMLIHMKSLRSPVADLRQFLTEKGRSVMKLQLYFDEEHMDERSRQLVRIPELFPELTAASSVFNNIEINDRRATKGQALRDLCGILRIPPESAVAIGDGSNDIDMICAAGLGIAMGNSCRELLDHAGWVTGSNNHSGFADAVRKILENLL